jgi:hypothetical protein
VRAVLFPKFGRRGNFQPNGSTIAHLADQFGRPIWRPIRQAGDRSVGCIRGLSEPRYVARHSVRLARAPVDEFRCVEFLFSFCSCQPTRGMLSKKQMGTPRSTRPRQSLSKPRGRQRGFPVGPSEGGVLAPLPSCTLMRRGQSCVLITACRSLCADRCVPIAVCRSLCADRCVPIAVYRSRRRRRTMFRRHRQSAWPSSA